MMLQSFAAVARKSAATVAFPTGCQQDEQNKRGDQDTEPKDAEDLNILKRLIS